MNYIPKGCDHQGRLTTGAINARCLAEERAEDRVWRRRTWVTCVAFTGLWALGITAWVLS